MTVSLNDNLRLGGSGGGSDTVLAAVDPTAVDDVTFYDVGQHWLNTDSEEEFVLTDNTDGAAVWKSTTAQASGAGSGDLLSTNNLSDLANAGTARTNLGLGTAAVTDTGTGATNTILGNDARLTDAREPTAHTHVSADITDLDAGGSVTAAAGDQIQVVDGVVSHKSIRKRLHVFEDFQYALNETIGQGASGSGAGFHRNVAVAGRVGITQGGTGTTATGRAVWGMPTGGSTPTVPLGSGECWIEWALRVPALSDIAETFVIRAGFADDVTGQDGADCALFRYDYTIASGNWLAVTRSNSSETTADTGIPVVANQFYNLRVVVNATASSIGYYIDDVLVATITTNIPVGANRATAPMASIRKSVGTTSRTLDVDRVEFVYEFTVAR